MVPPINENLNKGTNHSLELNILAFLILGQYPRIKFWCSQYDVYRHVQYDVPAVNPHLPES